MALQVQQESNAIDCGVFALAFIHYILSEKKTPAEVHFNIFKMRTHLLHCLVENEFSQFPSSDRNHRKYIHKTISIALFCDCRIPWAKSDNRLFDKQMVKCDGCCEWFSRMCERIPEKPFNEKYVKWYCRKCLLLKKPCVCLWRYITSPWLVVFLFSKHWKNKRNIFICTYSFVTPTTACTQ